MFPFLVLVINLGNDSSIHELKLRTFGRFLGYFNAFVLLVITKLLNFYGIC